MPRFGTTVGGREFIEQLTRDAEGLEDDGLELLIGMIDTLAETIVPRTPVDKDELYGHPGNARGAWHIRTSTRMLSTPSLDKDGSKTIRAIKRGIRQLNKVEDVVFDATEKMVPYMNRLNNGWSSQDRAFIDAGVAAVNARFPG